MILENNIKTFRKGNYVHDSDEIAKIIIFKKLVIAYKVGYVVFEVAHKYSPIIVASKR
jgi:hypothetical protein